MGSNLPEEINFEILSRTSLKSFDTMCCTNKEVSKFKYDPYFLNLYKQRNNIVSGFLVQNINRLKCFQEFVPSHDSKSLDLGFLPRDARILAASEMGIIVFESSPHSKRNLYHVCKPATKQVAALPNPNTKNLTEKVSIIVVGSNPLHYKIMRLSRPDHSYSQWQDEQHTKYFCEIFDSTAMAWRLLDDITLPDYIFMKPSQPITIGGSIYTLLTNNYVLKFDFYSEKWTSFPLQIPSIAANDPFECDLKLVKYQGKLAVACCTPSSYRWEVWVDTMNDDERWKKTFILNENEDIGRTALINSFYDSDTSVLLDFNTLVFYDFKKGDCVSKVVLSRSDMPVNIFAFRSDFEPVHLASGW